jgi:hypothetical protein
VTRLRKLRALLVGASLLTISGSVVSPASATSSGGTVMSSTVQVAPGWVVSTIHADGRTIKTYGRSGQSVQAVAAGADSVSYSITSPDPKKDPGAAAASGNSAVAALIALGVDPATALREFGSLDTLDGTTPTSDAELAAAAIARIGSAGNGTLSAGAVAPRLLSPAGPAGVLRPADAVTVSATVPYDTQCATVNERNGLIQGMGCSNLFVVWANGADWFFANKYKFSAQSTSTRLVGPLRLQQVKWRLAFSSTGSNQLFDWDPSAAVPKGSCSTTGVSSGGDPAHGNVGISISGTVCPDKLDLWGPLTSSQSGAYWIGNEGGVLGGPGDWEAAVGTQELHSPAGSSASHTSVFNIIYSCGFDC